MMRSLRAWMSVAVVASATTIGVASCHHKGRALSVDLRTDLLPQREFGSVATEVNGAAPVGHDATEAPKEYVDGTRVADFSDLDDGSVDVKVTLYDKDGAEVVTRLSRIQLTQDYALTVVATRSCAGVTCPLPDGDPSLTTCLAGKCAKPECTPDTPDQCPAAECAKDQDCMADVSCIAPICNAGVCLFPLSDAACMSGQRCNAEEGCVDASGKPPCTPTGTTETNCGDKKDDDCDGRVDCLDDDCNAKGCEDGDVCTTGETCQNGTCTGGAAMSCDDQNPCTDDSCVPKMGCQHTDATGPCDDGNACTTGDTCQNGTCKPGTAVSCDDENPCTDDYCDEKGGCAHTFNSAPCDDGDACTTGDVCSNGGCKAGTPTSCDDKNPCTDDTCDEKNGCAHTNNTGSCDDGVFCNGADTCSGGTCSVHAGAPCKQMCSEPMKLCIGCTVDTDCGPPMPGPWSACGGFADSCAESGTQTRTVTSFTCQANACVMAQTTEMQPCTRATDSMPCGTVTYGNWSACGGFASTCDTNGTQTRSVTTPTCMGGACQNAMSTDTQSCTRTTDGTSCGNTTYGSWSTCGGFASACDTTGSQSRTVTKYTCSSGSCASSKSSQSQSCTRTVSNGTSCGTGKYCCGGSCVGKNSPSHCGTCGIVCASGSCTAVSGVSPTEYGCKCSADSECVNDGYGSGATCWIAGGGWCQCQCPSGSTCGGLCKGGGTCHDVTGNNWCSYPLDVSCSLRRSAARSCNSSS